MAIFTGASCENEDRCYNKECYNGGRCIDGQCKCTNGYQGDHCQTYTKKTSTISPTNKQGGAENRLNDPVSGSVIVTQKVSRLHGKSHKMHICGISSRSCGKVSAVGPVVRYQQ